MTISNIAGAFKSSFEVSIPELLDGGELGLIREPIRSWLNTQAGIEDAQYLYRAWLNAGGELGVVRDPICKWAIEHGHSPAARSIRQAWLKAGGKPDDILWTV